jgi:hypothetical protein
MIYGLLQYYTGIKYCTFYNNIILHLQDPLFCFFCKKKQWLGAVIQSPFNSYIDKARAGYTLLNRL